MEIIKKSIQEALCSPQIILKLQLNLKVKEKWK